ncbi:MAG: arginine--tRNA ligase, partial [Pirellulales bacterium]
ELRKLNGQLKSSFDLLDGVLKKLFEFQANAKFMQLVNEHAKIGTAVLQETVKLHEGDEENLKLWHEFLPKCRYEIQRVYDRLDITFDVEYGESFYHDRLANVVSEFEKQGLAKESEGATCVFLDGFKAPMIIRKQDGAFLYATTDLATIAYRMETWKPDAMLYVVDHRQGEHFDKLFAAAKLWGCEDVEMKHISFGTVMGPDGKPYKTRSGDTVGLEGLLDEAVSRALTIVSDNDDKKESPDFSEEKRQTISELVGIGGLKYGDLSQNRETDYIFSYEKMLALNGNTATYMQYAYARVQSIFRRGSIDIEQLRANACGLQLNHPAERTLAVAILRFAEALDDVTFDYRPNLLTNYLFEELAKSYSTFFANCPVLKAEDEATKNSRALLCDLTARVIQQGLQLLGISTVEKM